MSKKTKFTSRKTISVSILGCDLVYLYPEQVLMTLNGNSLSKDKTIDIGSLCYLNREKLGVGGGPRKIKERLVDLNSLVVERRPFLIRIIEYLSQLALSGYSQTTLDSWFTYFRNFMDRYDSEFKHKEFPNKSNFVEYCRHLEHRTKLAANFKDRLSLNGAGMQQNKVASILAYCFSTTPEDFKSGIRLIRQSQASIVGTIEPDHNEVKTLLKTSFSLFDGITNLLCSGDRLPYKIDLPDRSIWLSHCQIKTLDYSRLDKVIPSKNICFDHIDGKVHSLESLRSAYPIFTQNRSDNFLKNKIKLEKTYLKNVNIEKRHQMKLLYSKIASKSFFLLFIANTGLNAQSAYDVKWDEKYDIVNANKDWRSVVIKERGKSEIIIEVGAKFKPLLIKYLKLREWILDGREFDKLFVQEDKNGELKPFNGIAITQHRNQLKIIFPQLPWVNPRQLRLFKGIWVLRTVGGDYKLASEVLQNSADTVKKSYSKGNESTSSLEFDKFWSSVRDAKNKSTLTNKDKENINLSSEDIQQASIPIGHCGSYKSPKRHDSFNEKSVSPDCKRADGCLFCKNFVIHINGEDFRKLLSCKQYLLYLRPHSNSEEDFLSEFGVIVSRIDEIIEQIIEYQPDLVKIIEKIKFEVKELGIFSPYWQNRLDQLVQLGV